jgi:hypothetical protein
MINQCPQNPGWPVDAGANVHPTRIAPGPGYAPRRPALGTGFCDLCRDWHVAGTLTAPEAAIAIWRICAADLAGLDYHQGSGEDHSVHVPDHGTGLELALSAWESDRITRPGGLTWQFECPLLTVADPWLPGLMRANGLVILRVRTGVIYCN